MHLPHACRSAARSSVCQLRNLLALKQLEARTTVDRAAPKPAGPHVSPVCRFTFPRGMSDVWWYRGAGAADAGADAPGDERGVLVGATPQEPGLARVDAQSTEVQPHACDADSARLPAPVQEASSRQDGMGVAAVLAGGTAVVGGLSGGGCVAGAPPLGELPLRRQEPEGAARWMH